MNPFWQELADRLGGAMAREGPTYVLFGELPGCEFTLTGLAGQVRQVELGYSEGENPRHLGQRLSEDAELGLQIRMASVAFDPQTVFFAPERVVWVLRSSQGPIAAQRVADLVQSLARVVTLGAPLRDRWCPGCGELECDLTRLEGDTVRLCESCCELFLSCRSDLRDLGRRELAPRREVDLSSLRLENLSPAAQLSRGAALEELLGRAPGRFWRKLLGLVALGYLALYGVFVVYALLLVDLGYWAVRAAQAGQLEQAWRLVGMVGMLLLLGLLFRGLWPLPLESLEEPEFLLERADQPELFAWLDRMADQVGSPRVDQVSVFSQINASAGERRVRGRWRPLVGIGLPLLELLSTEELAAIVAHELGHLRLGVRRTGWAHRASCRWIDLVSRLGPRGGPFTAFASWYLPELWLHVRALSRVEERQADAASAAVVSGACQARGLLQVEMLARLLGPALEQGLEREVEEGRRETFDPLCLAVDELERMPTQRFREASRSVLSEEASWLADHPETRRRLADLGYQPPEELELKLSDGPPASCLIRGYDELRGRVLLGLKVNCQVWVARERRFRRGRRSRAERLRLAEAERATAGGQMLLARLEGRVGRHEESWAAYRRVLELEPDYEAALLELAGTMYQERQSSRALEVLEQFLPADSLDFDLLRLGAACAERAEEVEKAREYLRRMLTVDLPPYQREEIQRKLERL